jgi:drug/metabolite transporter (DMT)-like permease
MTRLSNTDRHWLGVVCGVAAGAWLGAAEAPMKLVVTGASPFVISLGMVAGVFLARWTLPALLKGSEYIAADIGERPHLIVWALIAGMLWAVANALTVFAIRDIGLTIAFPLWNLNSLVGLFWGWLLFGELRGARGARLRVIAGVVILLGGAYLLTAGPAQAAATRGADGRAAAGVLAALGAAVLWGTMYVPYRKAYISGMNPLSFVAVFTVGELVSATALATAFEGGLAGVAAEIVAARHVLFWLFLGGFCWVIGDLFQQFAAKYIGIARGIPLSNTNQLWGLAWGMLVFGELQHLDAGARATVIAGSALMAIGAVAIGLAIAPDEELLAWQAAVERECRRYGLDHDRVLAAMHGDDPLSRTATTRHWWEWLIAAIAVGIGVALATAARAELLVLSRAWMAVLIAATLATLAAGGLLLWKRTRFA